MFKRLVSFILTAVIALTLFTGCSSESGQKTFDAQKFVDDCRILTPESQYNKSTMKNFEIDFIRNVLTKFGKSDFYKEMSDEEREAAFNDMGKILMTYSYGYAVNGFVEEFSVDMRKHQFFCIIKDFPDAELMWSMPGY